MKNGELIKLNEVLTKMVIPQNMEIDELYNYLSTKSDIESAVEPIDAKIGKFRDETIPEGVDEQALRNNDPKAIKWFEQFIEMRNKLMTEDYKGEAFKPCLTKDSFAKMAIGLQTFEAMIVMKYLIIKD